MAGFRRDGRAATHVAPRSSATHHGVTGMPSNDYHFITTWHVPATREEISDVLGDAAGLARWWPSVYLDVAVEEPGAADGVGRVVRASSRPCRRS